MFTKILENSGIFLVVVFELTVFYLVYHYFPSKARDIYLLMGKSKPGFKSALFLTPDFSAQLHEQGL
jgi:hypothetical protein